MGCVLQGKGRVTTVPPARHALAQHTRPQDDARSAWHQTPWMIRTRHVRQSASSVVRAVHPAKATEGASALRTVTSTLRSMDTLPCIAIPLHQVNADRAGFESSFADALVTQFAASEGVVIDNSNIMVRSIEVACDYSGQCQRAKVNYNVIVLSPCINDTTHPGGHCGAAKKAAMGAANAQVLSAAAAGTFKTVDIPGAEISSVDPNPPIPPPAAGDAALTTPLVMLLCMAVLLQL